MSLNSFNQPVAVVTSPCWNWTATNVFLQPAGAVYAYNSSIRVNGSTYFGTNSARGKITKVWIQAEYVDTHITQRLDRYQVMYNKYTFRCKILRNFGRYVQILYGTSASTCSFVQLSSRASEFVFRIPVNLSGWLERTRPTQKTR